MASSPDDDARRHEESLTSSTPDEPTHSRADASKHVLSGDPSSGDGDDDEEDNSDNDSEFEIIHDPLAQQQYEDDNDDDGGRDRGRNSRPRKGSGSTVQSFELYTPEEERAVVRKLDRRVVLPLAGLYLLSFIDRSNIGNAKIAGLSQDLGLTDGQFEWLLTGFYLTYISFEWMILLYHIIPAHIYVSLTVLAWGLLATCQSLVTTFPTMLFLRLGLGASEAAFSPGIPFYLSFFYRRSELAYRTGLQLAAAPLASSFAGTLAYVITKLAGANGPWAPWRLLFLVEGFPSVVAAVLAWGFVPDNVETAWFLNERERKVAGWRLRKERGFEVQSREEGVEGAGAGEKEKVRRRHVDWRGIWETLKDPKCYVTALMFLSCNVAFSSMPVFLPTVINEMGYSAITSQALSAPPYLLAFLLLLLTAWASDRFSTRTPFILLHAALGFTGYLLCTLGGLFEWSNTARYIAIFPACTGFFSCVTLLITLTINNQPSDARKGTGMTILNVVGQLGPLLGTRLYPDSDKPYYVMGMAVCSGFMGVVFALGLYLRVVLTRENERLRRSEEQDEVAGTELLRSGEKRKKGERFRLML